MTEEPLMDEDRLTLVRVATLLETVREDLKNMSEEIRRSTENKVSRPEWTQKNESVDERFGSLGREISEIKQEAATRRIPVTAWVAVLLASMGLAWAIVGPAVTGQ